MSDSQAIIAPQRGQRGWAKWAAIVAIGVAVMAAGVAGRVYYVLSSVDDDFLVLAQSQAEAQQLGIAELEASPAAATALGTPVTAAMTHSNITADSDGTGHAILSLSASGPKAKGTAFVEATRIHGAWTITTLTLHPNDGSDSAIEVIDATEKKPS